jgi:hypothetical protein
MKLYNSLVWALNAMELLSCFVAFAYYNKLRGTKWRLLPFYLLAIFALEMLGRYLGAEKSLRYLNPILFNYVSFPMQFLFFFYIFYRNPFFVRQKKLITVFTILYLVSVVLDYFYFRKSKLFFHSFSYSSGLVLLLILLIRYFYCLSTSERILFFARDIMFWFALGLFIYYIGTMPFWALRNMLTLENKELFLRYASIGYVLDCFMYLFFIIGVVKWKQNSSDL